MAGDLGHVHCPNCPALVPVSDDDVRRLVDHKVAPDPSDLPFSVTVNCQNCGHGFEVEYGALVRIKF